MKGQIINSVLIVLVCLVVFLLAKRSNENKFHLDFIIIHTFLLLSSTVVYKLIQLDAIGILFFDLINILHIASFVFLILHIESAVKGYKVKILGLFFIPIGLYIFVMILNYFGIYLLHYSTLKTIFLITQIEDPVYFSDKLFVKLVGNAALLAYLFRFCMAHIDASVTIKKTRLYKIWVYSYLILLFETLLVSSCYYFSILNPVFDASIHLIIRINAISSLLFFLANPVLLNYLPLIKRVHIVDPAILEDTFVLVKNLFQNEHLYLKKRLTIEDVVISVGSTIQKVQKAILTNTQLNFNDFVNAYRVDKSIELINNNYLIKMNLTSLAIESGFNSHQTFFRAFKKVKGCTPTEYRKSLTLNKSETL